MTEQATNPVSAFFSDDVIEDPYPLYDTLRSEGPAAHVPELDVWMVCGFDDCMEVVRNHDVFHQWDGSELNSANPEVAEEMAAMFGLDPDRVDGGLRAMSGEGGGLGMTVDTLVTANPPEHTRYRYVTNQAWSARRTAVEAEDRIRAVCRRLVDSFRPAGRAELMEQFANPLPAVVIAGILGLPESDWEEFKDWTQTGLTLLGGNLTREQVRPAIEAMMQLVGYLGGQIEQRRTHPTDDALTALLHAHDKEGRGLDQPELLSIALHLLGAGHETTINGLGNMAWLVLREDGVRDALLADPTLVPAAVAESLRLEAPVQFLFRQAVADHDLRGVTIPAGARVAAVWAAANRDPAEFPDPTRFDLHRPNARQHLAFGFGIHRCVGEPLSLKEMEVALAEIIALPDLRLAGGQSFRHNPHPFLRRLVELEVTFRAGDVARVA